MKGTILTCIMDLVEKRHGKAAWLKVLTTAGCPGALFIAGADVPDATAMKVIQATAQVAGVTMERLMELFGDYWANDYADKMYSGYYAVHRTAMDFLLNMDVLHEKLTRTIPNAHPPRFTYLRTSPTSFTMTYSSSRGLSAMLPGLIKGVARHYKTQVSVLPAGPSKYEVRF